MSPPILDQCRRVASQVEAAVAQLGSAWAGHGPLMNLCSRFRLEAEQLANNRGLAEITIAFVGPKKAGKTTLLGLLIESDDKRARLKAGRSSEQSTARPTWIGPHPPAGLDSSNELMIPCHESELVDLGYRYSLIDVPGSNESNTSRSEAARRALDSAMIKVLVVDRREIESREAAEYLGNADGSTIVPVINLKRNDEATPDLVAFAMRLRGELPRSTILPMIVVPDYEIANQRDEVLAQTRHALVQRLAAAVAGRAAAALAEPQLIEKLRRFKDEVARITAEHLPGTRAAIDGLRAVLETLPAKALEKMLGSDRLIAANVRGRMRAILLERTPLIFFPWRLSLSIANLVHGATDRIPLLFAGSIPSIVTTAVTATRNVKRAREFAADMESGLERRIAGALKEAASPQLRAVDHALQRDLKLSEQSAPHTAVTSVATLTGLDALQSRSAEIFHETIEKFAPARGTAAIIGFIGFALFWGIFGWPIVRLYEDFGAAAHDVWAAGMGAGASDILQRAFPSGAWAMLATTLLLAMLPMGLLLLAAVGVLTRGGRVRRCVRALRERHEHELAELTRAGLLSVEVSEPRIDACISLLTLPSRA
jgi:hypothetical protein